MLKKRDFLFYFIMPLIIGFLQVASCVYLYGWVTIFLFSFLFFSVSTSLKKSIVQGFIYGFIYFCVHSWGLLTFVKVNNFAWYYNFLPILYFLLSALYSSVWFLLLSLSKKYTNGLIRYFLYLHFTCFYLWWLHTKAFMIFGLSMGYPHLFPFLISINNNVLTFLFYKIGLSAGAYVILMINCFVAFLLEKRSYKATVFNLLGFIICLVIAHPFMYYQYKEDDKPIIIHMKPTYNDSNIYNMLARMSQSIIEKVENEDIKSDALLVFPESTLPFYFDTIQTKILNQNLPFYNTIKIALGAATRKKTKIHNSCFLVQKGRIILHYDKKILLPFWEFIPCAKNTLLNKIFGSFLKNLEPFSSGNPDLYSFFYLGNCIYLTLICSELFWLDFSLYDSHVSLLCILNDSHFKGSLLQKIMFLYARFIAGTQRRKVVYVGSLEGFIIYPDGVTIKKI